MYPAFQESVRNSYKSCLVEEIGWGMAAIFPIVSIFLNKYQGFTSGQTDRWAQDRLEEVIEIIRQKFPRSYILIRVHPSVLLVARRVVEFIDSLHLENVRRTDLHIYTLACVSEFAVSIAPSSAPILAMAFDCPVIEYGRLEGREAFYNTFPKGSFYSSFGVETAYTPTGLRRTIASLDESDEWLKTFHRELNDRSDLRFFEEYWG